MIIPHKPTDANLGSNGSSSSKANFHPLTNPIQDVNEKTKRINNKSNPFSPKSIMMKILHIIGSQTSEYYFCVSAMYGVGCINCFENDEHWILLAHLDGRWSVHKDLPKPLTQEDLLDVDDSLKMSLPLAMAQLDVDRPDIVQSHQFDYHGMVSCREIATLVDLPQVGSPGSVMALTTDKWQSRAIVESVGVPVPKAQLLTSPHDAIKMAPPFLLKPCREDNSMGISLVKDESDIHAAVQAAFEFDDHVLCEQFVPLGRELRVGVVESAEDPEKLELLAPIEYYLPQSKPIRTSADKLTEEPDEDSDTDDTADESESETESSSSPQGADKKSSDKKKSSKKKPVSLSFSPVDRAVSRDLVDETLRAKLFDMAAKSHKALGLKHYSLYDVRVDPDGEPFFIEASAYCSFAPSSAVVLMGSDKYPHPSDLFYRFARREMAAHAAEKNSKSTQTHGMRKKAAA